MVEDRDVIARMLAGMDRFKKWEAPVEEPGLPARGLHWLQQLGRLGANVTGGTLDMTNALANAAANDVKYFTGTERWGYDPFRTDIADTMANKASSAAESVGIPYVPPETMPPTDRLFSELARTAGETVVDPGPAMAKAFAAATPAFKMAAGVAVPALKRSLKAGREELAATRAAADIEAPAKKLTKAEREQAEKRATISRVAHERGFQPGENRQPFINPSEEELAAIRAEHGGWTGDPFLGPESSGGRPGYINTDIGDIFPPGGERTRPQANLARREAEVPGQTSERVQAMMENPEVRARIIEAAKAGQSVSGWYDTTPLQAVFKREFGDVEGQKRFEEFIGMVAGTSTGSDIGSNIKRASNYFSQKYGGGRNAAEQPYLRNLAVKEPEFWEVPPVGYGSDKQQTHMFNVNNYEAQGGFDPETNPKIAAFYENLLGNWQPTTIDKHAVRLGAMASKDPRFLTEQGKAAMEELKAGGMADAQVMDELLKRPTNWTDVPDKNLFEYPALERYWEGIAKEMGISPAQLQAQAWVGGGAQTGLGSPGVTFMDAFKDRIRRTAIRDNIPPDQVLKLMLHGKLTLAELEPSATEMPGSTMIG